MYVLGDSVGLQMEQALSEACAENRHLSQLKVRRRPPVEQAEARSVDQPRAARCDLQHDAARADGGAAHRRRAELEAVRVRECLRELATFALFAKLIWVAL